VPKFKFLMEFCSDRCYESAYKICSSVALSVPEIIAIEFLGGVTKPPNHGEEEAIGVGDGTVRKSLGEFL